MPTSSEHTASNNAKPKQADAPYDPRTKRGPPQRLEDTNAAGDALNDTGEDNQRQKEEE